MTAPTTEADTSTDTSGGLCDATRATGTGHGAKRTPRCADGTVYVNTDLPAPDGGDGPRLSVLLLVAAAQSEAWANALGTALTCTPSRAPAARTGETIPAGREEQKPYIQVPGALVELRGTDWVGHPPRPRPAATPTDLPYG